jgi:hypothetical protein
VREKPNFHYFECPECGFSSIQKAVFYGSGMLGWLHNDGHDRRQSSAPTLKEVVGNRPAWLNPPYPASEPERAGNS